ncbi:MAG: SDR family oxidoreductase [Flavobacteriaceae bacterium]|nr:SDR family oxidoreductase [Flavobacteriaceae bacterium]
MEAKKVVVTGASKGIGFELVKYLSKNGHHVLAITRNKDSIINLQKDHKNITVLELEITREIDVNAIRDFVSSTWGNIDAIIHNAGKLIHKPFFKTSMTDFMEVYKVNVFAVAELTKLLLPFVNKGGHVVGVSSMGGVQGSKKYPGLSAYTSSKGALITLFELLAEEYYESGIAFNTLAIGAVQTEMLKRAFPGYKASISAAAMAEYIADFSLYKARYFNGKVIPVSNSTP